MHEVGAAVTWSTTGPVGPTGAAGPAGTAGTAGPAGAAGAAGAAGKNGAVTAAIATAAGSPSVGTSNTSLLTTTLPAGSVMVTGKVELEALASTQNAGVQAFCQLGGGGASDGSYGTIVATEVNGLLSNYDGYVALPMQIALTTTGSTSVGISCRVQPVSDVSVISLSPSIVAVQATQISTLQTS